MLNRRALLATSGAVVLSACATRTPPVAAAGEDARLDGMLTRFFEAGLDRNPQQVTNLGLDVGARAAQRGQLSDRGVRAADADRDQTLAQLAELRTVDPARLGPDAKLSYDIALFQLDTQAGFVRRFPYFGGQGRPGPYIVTQLSGAYFDTPDFLDSQHPVANAADADAYLARLRAFADSLDGDTARVRENAGRGVVAPDFVLDKALGQLRALRDGPSAAKPIVASVGRRATAAGVAGDYGAQAASLFEGPVRAALTRQIDALTALRRGAVHTAGVHRLPDGEGYYAQSLLLHTTTSLTPDEVHQTGIEQVAELQSRIDGLLRAQGLTQGTVGQRVTALNTEPRFVWPNTDAGRADLLASLERQIAEITPRLPRVFRTLPKGAYAIRRVPPDIEQGAPGGYAQGGSLDGTRPGTFYINLKDTGEWPKWSLPTLTYHEAVPGHLFQGNLARERGDLPLYRRAGGGFAAYGEGWALYAERVADELGVYENDPFGRIGYLQSYLFRAVRLVVDTGLHSKRWSRERAIAYMVENASEPQGSAVREIERYAVTPGQACSYKLGQTVIQRLRDEAERRPGYDIKRFHDVVLRDGRMPLTVLEARVRAGMG